MLIFLFNHITKLNSEICLEDFGPDIVFLGRKSLQELLEIPCFEIVIVFGPFGWELFLRWKALHFGRHSMISSCLCWAFWFLNQRRRRSGLFSNTVLLLQRFWGDLPSLRQGFDIVGKLLFHQLWVQ